MKDPAVLIYFDKWIASTNGMKADFRAWYMDLMIYQFDKGGIPDDEDAIAGICRVLPSEYDKFKQMLKQVLKQKFKLIDGYYINEVMHEVLQKRKDFKEKRSKSGNIGVVVKTAKAMECFTDLQLKEIKDKLYLMEDDEIVKYKDKQMLKQMLQQLLKLYIDVDVIKDVFEVDKGNLKEINHFSETEKKMIVPEMVKIYTNKNKNYFPNMELDYHAILQIAYKIEAIKKWKKNEVTGVKEKDCLESWAKIVDFIKTNSFFSELTLDSIATDKMWQKIMNAMMSERKQEKQAPKKDTSNGFYVSSGEVPDDLVIE